MTLGYSRRGCAEGSLYDRMRTVVLCTTADVQGGRRAKFNTTFEAFARHWGFLPRLCQPYCAQMAYLAVARNLNQRDVDRCSCARPNQGTWW